MAPRRLRRLPAAPVALPGIDARIASSRGARLLGLAWLAVPAGPIALLLPGTRSIHTFGMRFALDLIWLDSDGNVVRVDRGVPPRRMRFCRGGRSVIECNAGHADAFLAAGVGSAATG